MAAKGSGNVINIGSMAGSLGLATGAAYGATKAALASLTQGWTAEYSGRGVRFNTVAPGPVYTRPEARDLFDALGETTAMKRAAEPPRSPRSSPSSSRRRPAMSPVRPSPSTAAAPPSEPARSLCGDWAPELI